MRNELKVHKVHKVTGVLRTVFIGSLATVDKALARVHKLYKPYKLYEPYKPLCTPYLVKIPIEIPPLKRDPKLSVNTFPAYPFT